MEIIEWGGIICYVMMMMRRLFNISSPVLILIGVIKSTDLILTIRLNVSNM